MSMFPGAYSTIITNEAGEPLGWDNHYHDDEPTYDDYADSVREAQAEAEYERYMQDKADEGLCCEEGDWYGSDPQSLWLCSWCHEVIPPQLHKGRGVLHPEEHSGTADWARVPRNPWWNKHHLHEMEVDLLDGLL
jgi:hypothetical protein